MYEWNEAVQQMIDWLDAHITETPTLLEMSRQIGYSPYYCSSQFHAITGVTLKNYMAARRLSLAARALRDTDTRILDIALNYGFSSQQALTRAFVYAFGCTPAAYRRNPGPIPVSMKKEVLFPEYYEQGDRDMEKTIFTEAKVRIEYIPAHKYIAIRDAQVQAYFPFFERHNCDEICGTIESMTLVVHESYRIARKRGRTDYLEDAPGTDIPTEDSHYELWDLVNTLDEEFRVVTILFYYEDLSIKEIGMILDIPVGTVKSRLTRARAKLKRLI